MSLNSSLYAGTSGLGNTGNALQVTSNNISNINTIGFKKGTATFADTLYQTIGTNAGASQVGLGMNVDAVAQVFTDGSLETTSNATDLAIGGDGFFIVSQAGSEETFYTRAGNFSFDENGALVSSAGYILQGWYVDGTTGEEYGAIKDLILTEFTSPPDDTGEITVITNLDSDAESMSTVLSNLFAYDEDTGNTMDSSGYEYQTVVTVYDSLGSSHEVTVYYDKKSDTDWEYVITCDPAEDNRALVAGTDAAGLLARGTITFSESSGEIVTMTMEELTGVIGNVDVSGNNTIDTVHFQIEDSTAIQLDGYGVSMTYDGSNWILDGTNLPAAYSNAEIIYSDATTVYLVLDPTSSGGIEEADLKISLDEYAMAGDTITFDINDPTDLHVQDIENAIYTGDAYNNTTISINDAGVMTTDAEGLSLIWNPYTETWAWSNPEGAASAGTLISDSSITTTAGTSSIAASFIDVTTADTMGMVVEDVSLFWNGSVWDWNQNLKDNDITSVVASTVESDTTPDISVTTSGSDGAATLAGGYTLTWDELTSTWSATTTSGATIGTVTTVADGLTMTIYSSGTSGASTIEVSLDDPMTTASGQTISFTIDSTPPAEYADALIVTSGNSDIIIDFDGDSSADVTIHVTAGTGTALLGDETFSFNVDPDVPPSEYSNATISGDATYVAIDLDGSGNEDDKQDIVFTFEDELKSGTDTDPLDDRSVITFDIEGATSWRTVETDEAKDTGYLQFTADFLGGQFGSTEADIAFNIGSKFNGNNWVNDSLSSTQYATSSSTIYQDADGYASGDLTGIGVDSDGLVSGTYSNGQELALFMIALADFNNVNGLKNEGGNLYSATTESGSAITNKPGQNGLGTLSSYALEMSNVDISEEFVSMIELQTAYEANAKIISTVDEMMGTIIGMKR
ncbi:flagellar hook-basal body complex protein [uncultured Desulfobacter sp.]|uniref:flagellar hook-basal body complex protein n=1 Tax=uncultured Desulfobacter sp. TaxID=240139 RepID=UPI002AAC1C1A|nr:flagellar hook-basal body complex protein [uncultured Desulfobacter sp.]